MGSFSLEKERERRNSAVVLNSLIDNDKNDGNKTFSGTQGSKRGEWTVCSLGMTAGKTLFHEECSAALKQVAERELSLCLCRFSKSG